MAVIEKAGFLKYKDADGNSYLLLPITSKDNVDGMDEVDAHIESQSNPHNVTADQISAVSYSAQTLTEEQKAQARANIEAAEACGVTYLESTDESNYASIRDLESGTYVFYGRYKPFASSSSTLSFTSKLLVNVVKRTADTQVMVFYPVNNCVQYLNITDDAYERKNIYLNDISDNINACVKTVNGNAPDTNGNVVIEGVPSCTTDDNGKFLRVVDGVATWESIYSAEEVAW